MNAFASLRDWKRRLNGWVIWSVIGAVAALIPSFYILFGLFGKPNENWQQIKDYMLFDSVVQSFYLVSGTLFFSVMIGVLLAWLVAAYDFPLRRFFHFAFLLPLAIPPYIAAYTFGSMFSYTGSIQVFIRNTFGVNLNQDYFDILSMKGAIFVFTLFLFPYIYLMTKTFLERQSAAFIENARLLGKGQLHVFFRIVIPLSQGAIIGGASLVAFEVLNDYGVTKHFGIASFTTTIFKTWFGMYDIESALRLAALLMLGIIALFIIERLLRRRKMYHSATSKLNPLKRRKLPIIIVFPALLFSTIIFSLSFAIPVVQLIVWATWTYEDVFDEKFAQLVWNTLLVSILAIGVLMLLAVIVANASRSFKRSVFSLAATKLILMGYSIPGAVLSIGVLALFISLDHRLSGLYGWLGIGSGKLVLSMSLVMLIFAYVVRFLGVGYNAVESGFDKIGNRYSEASRTLGMGITATFFKVDFPLIKGSILAGFLLTFMEIMKELPLTLLLRPYNFETLATKAYQYASDEQIHQASIPSLFIIAVGVVTVFFYHWLGEKKST